MRTTAQCPAYSFHHCWLSTVPILAIITEIRSFLFHHFWVCRLSSHVVSNHSENKSHTEDDCSSEQPVIDALWFIIPAAKHLLMICYASSHHILNTSRAFRDHIKLKRICKKHVNSWTHLGPGCDHNLLHSTVKTECHTFVYVWSKPAMWNLAIVKCGQGIWTGVDCFEHLQGSWKVWWILEKIASPHTEGDKEGQAWRSRGRRFRELQEHLCMPKVTRKGKAWRSRGRKFRELQERAKSERKDQAWRSRGRRDLEDSSSSSSSSVIVAAKNSLHTNSYTAAMQIKTISGAKSMPKRYSFSPQSPLLLLLFIASVAPLKVAGFWRYSSFCFVLSIALQCNKQTTYRHLISISWCRIKQAPLRPITILSFKAHLHVTKNQKWKKWSKIQNEKWEHKSFFTLKVTLSWHRRQAGDTHLWPKCVLDSRINWPTVCPNHFKEDETAITSCAVCTHKDTVLLHLPWKGRTWHHWLRVLYRAL